MPRIDLDRVGLTFRVRQRRQTPLKDVVLRELFRPAANPFVEIHSLKGIDLRLREGDRLGVIGHNGAGKSSLLRLLAGIYPPTEGRRSVEGRISSLFELGLGFEHDASGWENIACRSFLQGETPQSIRTKLQEIAEFSELGEHLDMPIRYYSAGMMVRLAFSIVTAIEPEILLIDEALAAGDLAFQQKSWKRMTQMVAKAQILVLVSHDLDSITSLCDQVIWLDHGRICAHGHAAEVVAGYQRHTNNSALRGLTEFLRMVNAIAYERRSGLLPSPVAAIASRTAVVLVNFNGGEHLLNCLDQLRRQTVIPRRVILVDNASQDGSLGLAEAFYPGIEVVRSPQNIGFAAANNLAIELATDCDWIALLNVDALAEPDWLQELLEAVCDHREAAFFGCRMLSAADPDVLDGTGDVYHASGLVWRRDGGRPTVAARTDSQVLAPCAAAALYRREALLEVGGFDERFFCYVEDVDLGFRLRLSGYEYCHVPAAVVRHVGSALTGSSSDFSVYHGHRNVVWTYWKNMPARLWWIYLPQHLLANLAAVAWFTLRGRPGVILRAKWDALRGLPALWRARCEVQSHRRVPWWKVRSWLAHGWLRPYRRDWHG